MGFPCDIHIFFFLFLWILDGAWLCERIFVCRMLPSVIPVLSGCPARRNTIKCGPPRAIKGSLFLYRVTMTRSQRQSRGEVTPSVLSNKCEFSEKNFISLCSWWLEIGSFVWFDLVCGIIFPVIPVLQCYIPRFPTLTLATHSVQARHG